jgi:hypothetical protein
MQRDYQNQCNENNDRKIIDYRNAVQLGLYILLVGAAYA